MKSTKNGGLYLLLFGVQTLGASIMFGNALPLFRDIVADPAAHEARVEPLIWGSLAVVLMQSGFWIRYRLRAPLPQFHNGPLGYLILFISRMSFLLATSIFVFIFLMKRPEFQIPLSRYFLTLVGLFSFFCYAQEVEGLGRRLIEPR